MKHFLLFLLIFLSSCRGNLKPIYDPVPPSISSGYYNGELIINGIQSGPIGVLEPAPTSQPSENVISIYGPHEGDILISSRKCGVEKSYHYTQGKTLDVNLADLINDFSQNCFFTITVTPFYPSWNQSEYPLYGYMMGLYLRVKPENFVYELKTNRGKSIQLREISSQDLVPPDLQGPLMIVNSTPGVRFAAFNCGPITQLEMDVPVSGLVQLDIDQLHKFNQGCLVQLKDKAGGFTPFIITIFKHDFIPLPDPSIEISKDTLKVNGSEFVTLTDVNGAEFYGGKISLNYEKGVKYTIRQYTIKGRVVICSFKDGKKDCWR